jgi:ribosomal protein S18 acetylase RimI-like enzyme
MEEEPRRLVVRSASEGDFQVAREIVLSAFLPATWYEKLIDLHGLFNGLDAVGMWQVRFADAFSASECVVGETKDGVVGCALYSLNRKTRIGYLDLLAIHPDWQQQGLGGEMLQATCDHMKRCGASAVLLLCDAGNAKASQMYATHGFQTVTQTLRWFKAL